MYFSLLKFDLLLLHFSNNASPLFVIKEDISLGITWRPQPQAYETSQQHATAFFGFLRHLQNCHCTSWTSSHRSIALWVPPCQEWIIVWLFSAPPYESCKNIEGLAPPRCPFIGVAGKTVVQIISIRQISAFGKWRSQLCWVINMYHMILCGESDFGWIFEKNILGKGF